MSTFGESNVPTCFLPPGAEVSGGGLAATKLREYGHCVSRAVGASAKCAREKEKRKKEHHVNGIKAEQHGNREEERQCKSHDVQGRVAGLFHRQNNFVRTLTGTRLY